MWFILLIFFPIKCVLLYVILIVLCKIDSYPTCCCSLLKVLNQNLNLKFHQIDFWFEFFDIHMNEKTITCHDCHGFKWQSINIYQILTIFFVVRHLFGLLDYAYTLAFGCKERITKNKQSFNV